MTSVVDALPAEQVNGQPTHGGQRAAGLEQRAQIHGEGIFGERDTGYQCAASRPACAFGALITRWGAGA